jgi:hypothetical protein
VDTKCWVLDDPVLEEQLRSREHWKGMDYGQEAKGFQSLLHPPIIWLTADTTIPKHTQFTIRLNERVECQPQFIEHEDDADDHAQVGERTSVARHSSLQRCTRHVHVVPYREGRRYTGDALSHPTS